MLTFHQLASQTIKIKMFAFVTGKDLTLLREFKMARLSEAQLNGDVGMLHSGMCQRAVVDHFNVA